MRRVSGYICIDRHALSRDIRFHAGVVIAMTPMMRLSATHTTRRYGTLRPHIRTRTAALACAAVAALAAAPHADAGIVTTYQFDLTEAPLGIFGQQHTRDYIVDSNEIIGGEIMDSRMHLEFNTDNPAGSMADAANLEVQFQPPVEGVPFWNVSGADLGWSGTGTFTGDISTDTLNLPILDLPPDSLSLWFVRIINNDDSDPFLGGQLTNSYIQVDVQTVPAPASAIGLGALAFSRRRRRRA